MAFSASALAAPPAAGAAQRSESAAPALGPLHIKTAGLALGPHGSDRAWAECDPGETVVAGGFDGLGGGEGLDVVGSYPGAILKDGGGPTGYAWYIDVENPTGNDRDIQVIAACLAAPGLTISMESTDAAVGSATRSVTASCRNGMARAGGGFRWRGTANAGVDGSYPQSNGRWTIDVHGDQRPVIRDAGGTVPRGSEEAGAPEASNADPAVSLGVTAYAVCLGGLKSAALPATGFDVAAQKQCSGGDSIFAPTCVYARTGHQDVTCSTGLLVAGGYQLASGAEPSAFPAIEDAPGDKYSVSVEGTTQTASSIAYRAYGVCLTAGAGSTTSAPQTSKGGQAVGGGNQQAADPSAGFNIDAAKRDVGDWFSSGAWQKPAGIAGAILIALVVLRVWAGRARHRRALALAAAAAAAPRQAPAAGPYIPPPPPQPPRQHQQRRDQPPVHLQILVTGRRSEYGDIREQT